ncbi:MAG: hypothetical protein BGN85_05645 [Alphaproteobacteria bacterium 64-11]|nr:type II and III secretion system protein family protein [Alphaproteobacteria bacterium]OJU10399.1 MAG: hypothetical protein BGN85_05645 [Alphaproteobacteria bacterium 64-11]
MRLCSFLLAADLVLAGLPAFAAAEPATAPLPAATADSLTEIQAGQTAGQLVVPLNKSRLLHLDRSYREISVGSKDVADAVPLSRNLIYVLGRKYGTTNLTIRGDGGTVLAVVDVVVTYDVSDLRQRLQELVPDEHVAVTPAGDSIVLSGQVSSGDHLHQIMTIADHFAPGKITNMLSVGGSQQVLLEMRFAEVERSALKDLGINTNLAYNDNRGSSVSSIMGTAAAAGGTFGAISGIFNSGQYNLSATLNALEKKGVVRTLAEPNLVALSGDTASFLAGGEFPIPVVQSINGAAPTVTIQYKDFGVGLGFTPTITGTDYINLVMNSEVSSLDNTAAISANGFTVPGLKVRRAKTTVELRDGQSFAIAGLLKNDFSNGISQYPWLGNIPILGTLFRSSNYQNDQTDLVVIITAHLVQPTLAKNLATPLSNLVLPTPSEHFGQGKVEDEGNNPAGTGEDQNHGYMLP